MPWYLSPSGWPAYADSVEEAWDLADRGYTPLDESQVQVAIDAYQVGGPAPVDDFLTGAEAAADIGTPGTLLGDAARAAFVAPADTDEGGIALPPVRDLSLAVERSWPNRQQDLRIVWADGATLYAFGPDQGLRKSTDSGETWTVRSANLNITLGYRDLFLKLATGELLTVHETAPLVIRRSTDDGATWTAVHTMRADVLALTSQSWAVDAVTGYIYFGEYQTTDTHTEVRILRSTDAGATWATFHTFPGGITADPDRVRHCHAVQWDPVSQRIYFSLGDNEDKAGLYRVDAGGTGVEAVVTSDQIEDLGVIATPIGLMFFPTHIAWITDSLVNPQLLRMARTEIGQASPVVESVYRVNGAGWGSVLASADGTTWLAGTSSETGPRMDRSIHVYAVTDNGARVQDVGHIPATGQDFAAFTCVGAPEKHDDRTWFGTRGMAVRDRYFRAHLVRGTRQIAPLEQPPRVYAWETVNGKASLASSGQEFFAYTVAPLTARRFHFFGAVVKKTAGTGTLRVQAVRLDTNAVIGDTSGTARGATTRLETSEFLSSVQLPGATEVGFRLIETAGGGTADGFANVTFGWGL